MPTTKAPSQNSIILTFLLNGGHITPLEALTRFKCFRLASRINDLSVKHKIERKRVDDPVTGKHWTEYWIEKSQTQTEG
jgi:hypothetical protein